VSRPDLRFVPIKTAEQQAALAVHKTREWLVKQHTMTIIGLRSMLPEFGVVAAKGKVKASICWKIAVGMTVPAT
jgi:transposase